MRTNRLHYLLPKLPFKSLVLALTASVFLSACGIKGDLYQTPEQAVVESEDADESAKPSELKANTPDDSVNLPATPQLIEQAEKVSIVPEKEQQ
jgi:predicted small lipoprotein YifL